MNHESYSSYFHANPTSQVTFRHLWMQEDVKTAIDSPRLHHQLVPMSVDAEIGTEKVIMRHMVFPFLQINSFNPQEIVSYLSSKGHDVQVKDPYFSLNYGGARVQAIAVKENGIITANNDRRKEGEVDGY